jgi:hypothetical protein
MGWVRGEWKPTEAEARAAMTYDKYGDELDSLNAELDDVVSGTLRDMAAKMWASLERGIPGPNVGQYLLQMVDPDQPDPEPLPELKG